MDHHSSWINWRYRWSIGLIGFLRAFVYVCRDLVEERKVQWLVSGGLLLVFFYQISYQWELLIIKKNNMINIII